VTPGKGKGGEGIINQRFAYGCIVFIPKVCLTVKIDKKGTGMCHKRNFCQRYTILYWYVFTRT
jgi:hypothetical protein